MKRTNNIMNATKFEIINLIVKTTFLFLYYVSSLSSSFFTDILLKIKL